MAAGDDQPLAEKREVKAKGLNALDSGTAFREGPSDPHPEPAPSFSAHSGDIRAHLVSRLSTKTTQ